jgi:hypothetical protein
MFNRLLRRPLPGGFAPETTTTAPPKGPKHRLKRLRTGIALALVAAGTGAAALTTGVTAASASGLAASGVYIQPSPSWTFFDLDVSGASTLPGAGVIQWWYNGHANQKWDFYGGNGQYQIVNENSDMCLTTDGIAGHQLYQWPCEAPANQSIDGEYQEWDTDILNTSGVNAAEIINDQTGLFVDVYGASLGAGTPIDGWYENDQWNQYFYKG